MVLAFTAENSMSFAITSEHLKLSKPVSTTIITIIFNEILSTGNFPEKLNSDTLTPVLKKSKDPKILDNNRGITVTPVFTKLFEYIYKYVPKLEQSFNQSRLQFGFIAGLSMLLAALLVSEFRAETTFLTALSLFLILNLNKYDAGPSLV